MSKEETIDLRLGSDGENHPRRLVILPNPNKSPHLLAYGGDDGTISLLENKDGKIQVKAARRFDDPVRAVASSRDGLRVAVGFEDGSTKIFCYSPKNDDSSSTDHHSFISKSEEGDVLDSFMSQAEDDLDSISPSSSDESSFAGPRFAAPIRHLEFDPRSYYLAIASEEGFCVVDATSSSKLSEGGRLLQDLGEKEHDSCGIRGLSYSTPTNADSKFTYLATLGMDGRLVIWDMTAPMGDPQLEWELLHRDSVKCIPKQDIGEVNGADPFDRSCLPVWSSKLLALPGQTDVQLRSLHEISKPCFLPSLEGRGHTDTIVATAFSPDGNYLVTSGRDDRVILWKLNQQAENMNHSDETEAGIFVCEIGKYKSTPTFLLWSSTLSNGGQDVLYIAFADGSLSTISGCDNIVPRVSEDKQAGRDDVDTEKDLTSQEASDGEAVPPMDERDRLESGRKRLKKDHPSKGDDSDEDDDVFQEDEDDGPQIAKKSTAVNFLEDEAVEEEDEAVEEAEAAPSAAVKEGAANTETEERSRRSEEGFNFDSDDRHNEIVPLEVSRHQTVSLPAPQPAFAPSSTPLDLPRRIMCWNHIGTVSLLRNPDGLARNTVDIDFTDIASRRPVSFTDNMDFILGSLGEDGAIFATDTSEDDIYDNDDVGSLVDGLHMSETTKAAVKSSRKKKGDEASDPTGSSIYFHRFETFGPLRDKDWYWKLPNGERAMGCACGEGWAAVLTSRRFLRLFTSGGNQGQILWIPGEPVTVVGRGRFLAVFYHDAAPLLDGTQKLGFTLFDAAKSRTIKSGSVSCISTGASLSWAGFSDDCSLMAMDSDGMLSMLSCMASTDGNDIEPAAPGLYSWGWAPVLDTVGLRKSVDDSFWPVTIQGGKLVCVPLKGGNEHPDAARRPVTHTLGLRLPLARVAQDKSFLQEELSIRANMALKQKKFLFDVLASDEADSGENQDEYDALCGQVDKVTLKLFIATVEAGKLERSLDLVNRLHLEKSFEIAIRVSDQCNHRILSDRIENVKDRRFSDFLRDGEVVDGSFVVPRDYEETPQHREIGRDNAKPQRRKRMLEESDDVGSPSPQPVQSRARLSDHDSQAKVPNRKSSNPFAKKRMESPAKPRKDPLSPTRSPSKVALSRSSTFSTQSRLQSKVSRSIM